MKKNKTSFKFDTAGLPLGPLFFLKGNNGARQGGVTSGILFNFYLNEVLTNLAILSLGYELSGNRVNNFCYADDITLLAHTENALQFMLHTLSPKFGNFSVKINVGKPCNIVFKHESRRISTNLTL